MPGWLIALLVVGGLILLAGRRALVRWWREGDYMNYISHDEAVQAVMGFLPHEHPEWLFDSKPPATSSKEVRRAPEI